MIADHDTVLSAQRQMNQAALDLAKMANDVADAKFVKQYDSDRLKRAFSVAVATFLGQGNSATAAEHLARAGDHYGTAMFDLGEQYKSAMRVIEKHNATMVKYESARSLLSLEKAKINL